MSWRRLLLTALLTLRRDTADPDFRDACRAEIVANAVPSFEYYLLTVIATVTATYGLLADSTAVIIGAMLLAPLMGPIFGIALAIGDGDEQLLWRSIQGECYGVLVAIGIALVIGLAPYRPEFGANILARTTPTIYDLMIAFAAGLGGAMGLVNKRISASLPGVAIAVALLPPLGTVGICLADGWWAGAGGAFLLFFVNFLAIAFMATVAFIATGLARIRPSALSTHGLSRHLGLTIVILGFMGIFLMQTLLNIVEEQQLNRQVREALIQELATHPGTDLDELRIERRGDNLRVAAVVLTTEAIEAATVADLESAMVKRLRRPLTLLVRSLQTQDRDRDGAVYLNPVLSERSEAAAEESERLRRITTVLRSELQPIPGAELGQVTWQPGEPLLVSANVRTPEALRPDQVAMIEAALEQEQGQPVRLVIRSMLTRDADAERFLYDVSELPPAAAAIRSALYESARVHLLLLDAEFELKELRYGLQEDRLRVLLRVAGPQVISREEVAQVEQGLRLDVSQAIDLAIQVAVSVEVTAAGIDSDPLTEFLRGTTPESRILTVPQPPATVILPTTSDDAPHNSQPG